jgi:hypothetical protein
MSADSTQPSGKRQRVDSEPESFTPPTIVRGDPWLDDGNILLQADGTRFRIVKSLLMARSEVFRDLFTLAHAGDTELDDGCPVITLQDSASDLAQLLKAIYTYAYDTAVIIHTPFADGTKGISHLER